MEGLLCLELPLPGTTASRRTIPRSPLSPPLTRGPNQPVNVPAAARSGGMRASRPTVARVVAVIRVGLAFAMVRRGGPWPSRGTLRRRGVSGTMQASSPTLVCGIAGFVISRLATAFCLPCQREVARPQAVTEGLFYGQMPFQRSDVTEKFFFFELRLPGTSASFYAIPRSPLSPPLTRGPNQPVNVPAAARSGGMRASRPTVARVVEAALVGHSVLPPLSKGGGTAAGRDGGIALRLDAV